jgi:hypothetical protein
MDATIRYASLATVGKPTIVLEALDSKDWKQAMDNEIQGWHLVPPQGKTNVTD